MSLNLILTMICASIILVIITTHFLKKGRIPEKYALLWYAFSLFILVLSLFPSIFTKLAKFLGFETPSNMIMLLLIAMLFLLVMALTIMIAGQKKKTTLLIQEISLLKKQIRDGDK